MENTTLGISNLIGDIATLLLCYVAFTLRRAVKDFDKAITDIRKLQDEILILKREHEKNHK